MEVASKLEEVEDCYRAITKEKLRTSESRRGRRPVLYIHGLRASGSQSEGQGYPFKSTSDFVGIAYDR